MRNSSFELEQRRVKIRTQILISNPRYLILDTGFNRDPVFSTSTLGIGIRPCE